jgi:hypothetical protein
VIMKYCYFLVLAVLAHTASAARFDAHNPSKEEIAALRGVIEENFRAQTEENLNGVMSTISLTIPPQQRAELAQELQSCFDETDLQLKLVSLRISSYQHPSINPQGGRRIGPAATAYADVVQLTTKRVYSYGDLGEYPAELSTYYRHNSAMLPQTELVRYTLKFIHDGRAGWKAQKITSRVKPVGRWPDHLDEVMSPDYKPAAECATGNCRFIETR